MFAKFIQFSAVVLFAMVGLLSLPSTAQELSKSHLKAARAAVNATKATESFDSILLNTSSQLKAQLIGNSPDQADKITEVVDAEAIALATRRADLEGEAARLFANSFTEAELGDLAAFFNSPVGSKYLAATPILARELAKSARIWANGIGRDLQANVQKKLAPANN